MTESSSISDLPIESRRRWNSGGKAYCEWTHEGDAEMETEYASRDLHPLSRKHVCWYMKMSGALRAI